MRDPFYCLAHPRAARPSLLSEPEGRTVRINAGRCSSRPNISVLLGPNISNIDPYSKMWLHDAVKSIEHRLAQTQNLAWQRAMSFPLGMMPFSLTRNSSWCFSSDVNCSGYLIKHFTIRNQKGFDHGCLSCVSCYCKSR